MNSREPKYCESRAFAAFDEALGSLDNPLGLFSAAVAISLHFLPNHSMQPSIDSLKEMAETVRRRVHHVTPDALVARLHEVMFDELGFTGNDHDYFALDNSLIPRVLETKQGMPITLSLIYACVGRLSGLQIVGINSPGHFLVRVQLEHDVMLVDPYHGGRVLSTDEGIALIERVLQQPLHDEEDWFPVCSPRLWLQRILNNLRSTLIHTGHYRDVAAMRELQSVLNEAGM
jgi:regulator of sirC expression with transglutaminase-like and TPR domain